MTRVNGLQSDKDRLLAACERHQAASQAHADGERKAVLRAKTAERTLKDLRARAALQEQTLLEEKEELQQNMELQKDKYEKLKRYCRKFDPQ